jgi:phage shock protein PspC (stress-responsive transcriptional regulator)
MRRIYRERFDKKIGGVCGGLAQYFQLDASIIRLIWAFLSLVSAGFFILVYILCWAIIPLGPKAYVIANYKKLFRSTTDRRVCGICGGLGKYFNIDSNILRLAFVVITFITAFTPIILYLIGTYIIPEEPKNNF